MCSPMQWLRSFAAFAALTATLLLWPDAADARLEGELSFATSGPRILISPPAEPATPIMTAASDHPAISQSTLQGGSLGGLFNRPGLLGGFAAGFLGSGLLGLMFGHGMFGGLNSVVSFFGLLFQLSLVAMLGRLIWTWWNGRNMPVFAGLSPRQLADPYLRSRQDLHPSVEAPEGADDEKPLRGTRS